MKKEALPVIVFALLALFYICKSLYLPGCYVFDISDHRNHIFPNLFAAKEILAQGEIPQINFYNNFGTPLLGDAITYPFALQSLTYYLAPAPLASTINACLAAFLTMLVLYALYRNFWGPFPSAVAAIFCFHAPGILRHAPLHHFQTAPLWFACLLLLLAKAVRGKISVAVYGPAVFIVTVFLSLARASTWWPLLYPCFSRRA